MNNQVITTQPTTPHDPLQPPSEMISYNSTEEMIEILRQGQKVDMKAEDMDPLEWAFRSIVPIPEHYYWDVVPESQEEIIPARIRWWHRSLFALSRVSQWTEINVGQPLVRTLGLDTPRMSDVTMFMSEKDWKRSQRIVIERQNQRTEEESPPVIDRSDESSEQ